MDKLVLRNTETGEETAHYDAVDVLNVGGTVRWADREGNPQSAPDSRVVSVSGTINVGIKSPVTSEKRAYPNARTARFDPESKMVYLSGPGWVEREVGEVVRVRDANLPRT